LDGHGSVKKTETEDADIFYVAGARIHRLTRKNGKELSRTSRRRKPSGSTKKSPKQRKNRASQLTSAMS